MDETLFRKKTSDSESDTEGAKCGDDTIIEGIPALFYQLGLSQYIDTRTLSNNSMFF